MFPAGKCCHFLLYCNAATGPTGLLQKDRVARKNAVIQTHLKSHLHTIFLFLFLSCSLLLLFFLSSSRSSFPLLSSLSFSFFSSFPLLLYASLSSSLLLWSIWFCSPPRGCVRGNCVSVPCQRCGPIAAALIMMWLVWLSENVESELCLGPWDTLGPNGWKISVAEHPVVLRRPLWTSKDVRFFFLLSFRWLAFFGHCILLRRQCFSKSPFTWSELF